MPRLRMTETEKKTARKLRRMGLTAQTARQWTFHAQRNVNEHDESLCVHQPQLRSRRNASRLDILKSLVDRTEANNAAN